MSHRQTRRFAVVAMTFGLALGAAACAETASSPSAAGNSSGTASCGAIPTKPPADPDGVLAKLPASVQPGYNLYPDPVYASAWVHWKPTHPGPYTIALSGGEFADPFSVVF